MSALLNSNAPLVSCCTRICYGFTNRVLNIDNNMIKNGVQLYKY